MSSRRARRTVGLFASTVALLALSGCAPTTTERLGLGPLQTVHHVDLGRYVGTWYDIASFPQWFSEDCTGTTATYALRDDGEIDVTNRCHKQSLDGELDSSEGRARVVEPTSNAKLEVSFFRPFWGDYWIIDLAPDYSYAVVGHPSRDYLWILSRTPTMAPDVYAGILERLRAQGYELDRLQKTIQRVAVTRQPAAG
jgi:apolipoprotein D and lipocalin family protein